MTKPKSLDQRRIDWKEQWISENIPSGVKYNPFLHKRIPVNSDLSKLESYTCKLIKDGLNNNMINERLQKYRKTQLLDEDIDDIRENVTFLEQIKNDDKKRTEITDKINILKGEIHKVHLDYLWNVQSPYLQMEEIMVKEHCNEYPEYMDLMKKKEEYLKVEEEFKSKIKKLENQIYKI